MSYVESVVKYTLIIIIAMFLRIGVKVGVTNVESPNLSYHNANVLNDQVNFQKPKFENEKINKFIDDYIVTNSCSNLDYSIFKMNYRYVNIFLNCGKSKNYIYDTINDKTLNMTDIIKDVPSFVSKVHELLNLKYPKYVADKITVLSGSFDIRCDKIIGYFDGGYSVTINNNMIRGLMKYPQKYNKTYENEKYELSKDKKTIAFTFDDGPSIYDKEIVDTLSEDHAKATFFIVGNRIDTYSKTIDYMLDHGMEIGNHTFDHKALVKLTDDEVLNEINSTKSLFKQRKNKDMILFRPSYGAIKKEILEKAGVPVVLWSVDTEDWRYRDTEKVYNAIMSNVKDGDIVLMHSLYKTTADAIKLAIPKLQEEGYQIVSVSELMKLKGKTMEAGNTYYDAR